MNRKAFAVLTVGIVILALLCVRIERKPIVEQERIVLTWTGYDAEGNRIGGRIYTNTSIVVGYEITITFLGIEVYHDQC